MKFIEEKLSKLKALISQIPNLKKEDQVFDLMCRILYEFQGCTEENLRILELHNLHINSVWNIFHCSLFLDNLKILLNADYIDREKMFKEKEVLQLLLRISFLMISIFIPILNKKTVFFLYEQMNRSIKSIHKKVLYNYSLSQLLLTLEEINYNATYRFGQRIPHRLNRRFFRMNQIASRMLLGSLLIYNLQNSVLPDIITKIVNHAESPKKLFWYTHKMSNKIKEYQNYNRLLGDELFEEKRRKCIKNFLLLLKDQNLENFIFLVNEISLDYRSFQESMDEKIKNSLQIKRKIQKRFEELSVFVNNDDLCGDWSNKIFLNTIKFLSTIEAIKNAKNGKWKRKAFGFFFNQWLKDLHDAINYRNDKWIDKIKIYVEGRSDKIILENAYDKLHPKHNNFLFYDSGGKEELSKKINAVQISDFEELSFGIFDFDEAYNNFNGLRRGEGCFGEIKGSEKECLFRYRENGYNKIFALLLPVPETRASIASAEIRERSILSIEMLFSDEILMNCSKLTKKMIPGGGSVLIFSGNKIKFAEKTKNFQKENFINFIPLFNRLFELIKKS